VVRLAYALLSIFDSNNAKWSDLSGSIAALVLMHSLMEYCVVIILLVCGYSLEPFNRPSESEVDQGTRRKLSAPEHDEFV
jgi:hypothetical protein